MEVGDKAALAEALAADVAFRSPAIHRPYLGREAVMTVLAAAVDVLQALTYTDCVEGPERTVLFFTARVGERQVEGIDALRFDARGRVQELTVMIRPLSALTAVAEGMGRRLGASAAERNRL
jgi:hypothetical protein